ncbi:glucose-1-phosphate adenylyltransferase [Ornithobacterium rhinotracheale]|uniref:glucose-1-phosphate adenylyltransferase n=1 Tax=Ornithobacterium rhinotracheale TaxID=28251 RepID=UPI00129D0EA2|nr:glucose-1-phosphate adenylyltransferase [Ornithobacterium rhinotracheale]MRJ11032.1 glucose-1-phosphate adenylyltransferase [Ornithobacterium rhinotracheale]
MKENQKILALILGGGRGTRLQPLTSERSKPAVPLAGKYRLVDIPISNCLNSGINRIFVLTQFNSASLNRHIKNSYSFDLFSKGFVDILAAEQTDDNGDWYQGTADAVRQSLQHYKNLDYDYMLILSGDQLYQMDFQDMLKKHIESNAELSIATIPVNASDATGFGIMKTNESNQITSFVEKPDTEELKNWSSDTGKEMQAKGRDYLASMGIYLFNKKVLNKLLEENEGTDFGKHIIPGSIENHKVLSYQFEGYWTDIGTIKSFHEANLDLASHLPLFNLYDNTNQIYTHARMLPPAKVEGTSLERVVLSEGSIVHASRLENCVIGIRTRIGKGTTVTDSYIMGSDYYESLEQIEENKRKKIPPIGIGERCFINNAIIDKNVRIGNDVRINGHKGLKDSETNEYKVVDGIVVVKKGAILPDGFSI